MGLILVTSRSFSGGRQDLAAHAKRAGHTVLRGSVDHDLTTLAPLLARADAWIAGTRPIVEAHLLAAPNLRIIARHGVGTDAIDLDAADRRGIVVTNTPGANGRAVAELAVALALAASRHLTDGDRRVRAGDWSARRGTELSGATVGLIGFGRIGQAVAGMLSAFGSRVVASDPVVDPARIREQGVEPVALGALLARSDLISLHAPGGQRIIGRAELAAISPGAVLVNTARADLVDEDAVAHALRTGALAAYAADSLVGESTSAGSALLAADIADRVTLTPHLGAQTVQAVDAMGSAALGDVIAVLAGSEPRHPVVPRTFDGARA